VTNGICFYIDYGMPACQLVVALHTLEQNYDGEICVLIGKSTPSFLVSELRKHSRVIVQEANVAFDKPGAKRQRVCWFTKVLLHKHCNPFDVTVFYDCDHVFKGRVGDDLFKTVSDNGLVSCNRTDDKGWKVARYIEAQLGEKCPNLKKANGGCVGSVRGSPLVDEWVFNLNRFYDAGGHLKRHADEYSLDYVMERHNIGIGSSNWSHSVGKYEQWDSFEKDPAIVALHYPQRRYVRSSLFKLALQSAMYNNFLSVCSLFQSYSLMDGVMLLDGIAPK